MTNHMKMQHKVNPRAELMSKVNVSGIEIFGNHVLVAIYERPDTTAGGIILADKTRDEDRYQGKIGLVIKKGPSAFVDSGQWTFDGMNVEIGDWVAFRTAEAWSMKVDGVIFRLVPDYQIRLRVDEPDRIY